LIDIDKILPLTDRSIGAQFSQVKGYFHYIINIPEICDENSRPFRPASGDLEETDLRNKENVPSMLLKLNDEFMMI
jgi:hypothetical protein